MTIDLLFGVHAHQPVGNFPHVIEHAHRLCYRPFLQTLERYPGFRFSMHMSGWLLDWLADNHPQDLASLRAMTARGQIEWFGSGDCEPVLSAIPQRDRLAQLATLSAKIERLFGQWPRGAWLTERVWEPSVVTALRDTGIEYVAVDDYHFLCTGQPHDRLDGFWTTEEDGRTLDLYPVSEAARYRVPFSDAEATVTWLEHLASEGRRAAIYFDDIEKFGIWPDTYDWVYGKRWLERFIEGVLASPLIRTVTFAGHHDANVTQGVIYLPTTSYMEMNEWTLPAPAARAYRSLVERERSANPSADRHDASQAWLRGGIWRNFLSRYPEANWMHKRMLRLSARLAALPEAARTSTQQMWLHRAQANDAYWHGLFGGLYLPHLRRAVWHNLLTLERELDRLLPRTALSCSDIDLDGHLEWMLYDAALQAVVRDDGDGALIELSSYRCAHNFGDTLRRRDEAYYDTLQLDAPVPSGEGGIVSAHDRVVTAEGITPEDLIPDARPRGLFVDHWIGPDGTRHALDAYRHTGEAASFASACDGGTVHKSFSVSEGCLTVRYRIDRLSGQFETTLNIAMPSCDGFAGRYVLADGSMPCGFGQTLSLAEASRLTLDDRILGGALQLDFPPAAVDTRPCFTVSRCESGVERIMQSAEVTLRWPLDTAGTVLTVTVRCAADPA
jgi:hypothetical protein